MPLIKPFAAIRYNQKLIGDLRNVTAPPYDMITPEDRRLLYNRHRSNVIRMLLREEVPGQDKYKMAAQEMPQLLQAKLLIQDPVPGYYLFRDRFRLAGRDYTRVGVYHLLRLEEPGKGTIHPHASFLRAPMEDRFRLLQSLEADVCPILALLDDEDRALRSWLQVQTRQLTPLIKVLDYQDVEREIFLLQDPVEIKALTTLFSERHLFLADGHHRYAAALAYRDWRRQRDNVTSPFGEAPADYILCATLSLLEPSLLLQPCHRVVFGFDPAKVAGLLAGLAEKFQVEELPHYSELKTRMDLDPECIGFATGARRIYLLKLKDKNFLERHLPQGSPTLHSLPLCALQVLILEDLLGIQAEDLKEGRYVKYFRGRAEAFASLQKDEENQLAFFLGTASSMTLKSIGLAGELLPPKAFHIQPNLLTGLLMHKFEG